MDPTNEGLFTWWAPWRNMRARNIGWRLDYILASEPLGRAAASCVVAAQFGTSDHAPVVAEFRG
jgi:exodeoxyribonuclease-3